MEALRAFSAGSPLQDGDMGPLLHRPLVLSLCRLAWAPHIRTAMDWLISTELWLSLFTLRVSGDRVPMRLTAGCGGDGGTRRLDDRRGSNRRGLQQVFPRAHQWGHREAPRVADASPLFTVDVT